MVSVFWENVVSVRGAATDYNRGSLGNFVGLYLFLLILCLPNVSNKPYNETGSDKFSSQHKGVILSVSWENVLSSRGAATTYNG